jgi:PTH1 family peptidyl-tRNA hydrolase
MSDIKLIVGLGNPGVTYENTRHNLGFQIVREVAKRLNASFKPSSLTKAWTAEGRYQEEDLILMLPATFMNCSGPAIEKVAARKSIDLNDILIVCDDIDLEFGRLRIRANGSTGGHNGLKSIAGSFNSTEFGRLRAGIGRPGHKDAVVDFVLEKFSGAERKQLPEVIERAADCCLSWCKDGIEKAMELYNRKQLQSDDGTK